MGMTTQQTSIRTGYKRTEVGVIPEDWEVKNLDAVVRYRNGRAHEKSISDYGKYVVVNSKFISSEGEIRKYSNDCFCPTSTGDVLMVMSDVPNGRAIAKCYWVERDQTYTVNQRVCALSPQDVDGKFLFYKLNRNPFYLAFDDGAKQTNLRKDDVLSCPLGIPKSGVEQRAIARALSDMDALIDSLEKFIAKKRDLKQAAIQQLLTGQCRLPGFDRKWETQKLEQIVDIQKGRGLSKSLLDESGLHACILYGELFTTYAEEIKVVKSKTNSTEGILSEFGDVLLPGSTTTTGIDLAKASALLLERVLLGGDIIVLRNMRKKFNPTFLAYTLTHIKKMEILKVTKGITIYHLHGKDLLSIEIELPCVDEQTEIAAVLSDMEAEIAALDRRCDKTRTLKQGMMQELLTGKTRLI